MKVLSVAVFSLLFCFIQTAAELSCRSYCAACWKTGQPGVDIKIGCGFRGRCHGCPPGYESIHCAKKERCQWVDLSMPLFITILFSFILACMFKFFLNCIGAKNLIVKYLAHVIVESPRRMGRKAARYQIGVRRVRVDLKKGLVLLLERHGWVLLLIEQTSQYVLHRCRRSI